MKNTKVSRRPYGLAILLISAVALFGLGLGGCEGGLSGGFGFDHHKQKEVSRARAKSMARLPLKEADVPQGFVDCEAGHSANASYDEDERGISFHISEYNTRNCPPITLKPSGQVTTEPVSDSDYVEWKEKQE